MGKERKSKSIIIIAQLQSEFEYSSEMAIAITFRLTLNQKTMDHRD
jgi:hypothetical protein